MTPDRTTDPRRDLRGEIPGASRAEQAIRLAGALAEAGEHTLRLTGPRTHPRELAARATDLPGEIARASCTPGAVLECPGLGIRVPLAPDRLEWEATRLSDAVRMRALLGTGNSGERAGSAPD